MRVRHCSRGHTALPACLTCSHSPPHQSLPYRYTFPRLAAAQTQPAQRHSQPPSFRGRRGRSGQVQRRHIPAVRGCGSCSRTWETGQGACLRIQFYPWAQCWGVNFVSCCARTGAGCYHAFAFSISNSG